MTVKVARMVGLPTSSTARTAVARKLRPGCLAVMPLDVLHHHDGVVHQDADGEDEGEEGDPVQGVAGQEVDEEGEGQGHGHRDADHEAAAPAHGERDEGHHREGGEEQVLDELVRLLPGRLAVVAGDLHVHVRGKQPRPERLDLAEGALGEVGGVGARALGEGDGHRRVLDSRGRLRRGARRAHRVEDGVGASRRGRR